VSLFSHFHRFWTLESFKPDIALARDEASRFLPWIIALMVYLAALTLAGSFTLHRTVMAGHAAQIQSFSVHLPHMNDKADETVDKVLSVVKNTPGVTDAQIVTIGRIKEMVEPWLGSSAALSSLPLPMIIEGKLAASASIDYAQLKAKIDTIAPGSDIDDHKQWIAQFSSLVHLVQWVLFVIAFFIIAATAFVVIFACKTSLKIHRSTVSLLHRLGAMDSYIARQFQNYAALLALKGAFVGSGFAAGTILGIHIMARHIDSPLFPSFALTLSHWLILVTLPLFMSLLALLSARTSVLATLHKMP
jgi:cell division transport system permease protein